MSDPGKRTQVDEALARLRRESRPVTFTAVAAITGISRASLYRDTELADVISRQRDRDLHPEATLSDDLEHLRRGVEALSERLREHEERLRRLEHRSPHTTRP